MSFLPCPLTEFTSDMRAIHNYEDFVPRGSDSDFSVKAGKDQALYSEGMWFVQSRYMFKFYVEKETCVHQGGPRIKKKYPGSIFF